MDFRRKALDSLREPDELDSPVQLARPRAWVALVVAAAVMSAGVAWCCYGQIPRTVSGPGILTYPSGVSAMQGAWSGDVGTIFAQAGTILPSGTPVMSILTPGGGQKLVRSPFGGVVTNVLVASGQFVTPGTSLVDMERTDGPNSRVQAQVYVSAAQAAGVQPGDQVSLAVSSAPPQAFGVLRGSVTSVDAFPETRQQILAFLGGNELLGNSFLTMGDPIRVTVALNLDPSTASGFQWSTKAGPPFPVQSQTPVTAAISLPGQRPITWLLPG